MQKEVGGEDSGAISLIEFEKWYIQDSLNRDADEAEKAPTKARTKGKRNKSRRKSKSEEDESNDEVGLDNAGEN
jgi:hypothetical protein